jgi:hypothetical protein
MLCKKELLRLPDRPPGPVIGPAEGPEALAGDDNNENQTAETQH